MCGSRAKRRRQGFSSRRHGAAGRPVEPLGPTSFAEARESFASKPCLLDAGMDLLILETFGI